MAGIDAAGSRARAEAAVWLARLRSADVTQADRQAFQLWLDQEPAHAAAFEKATAIWDCVGGLGGDLRAERGDAQRSLAVAPPLHRRAVMAGLGAVVLAGAGTLWSRSLQARVYETEVGEQKHIVLDDGSQLFLDTATSIRNDFSQDQRAVDLRYGRVNFAVSPRPTSFLVNAAGRQIIADRAVFDVSCDPNRLCVLVIHGQALVKSAAEGAPLRVLNGGDRLTIANSRDVTVDRPDLVPLTAWQSNQAIFQNETLADAIQEMNRYSTVKLQIDDPAVANLRISGVYRVGDVAAFAGSVAQLLPLSVLPGNGRILLVRSRNRVREG